MFPDLHSFTGRHKTDNYKLPLLVTIFEQVRLNRAHITLENFPMFVKVFGYGFFGHDYDETSFKAIYNESV